MRCGRSQKQVGACLLVEAPAACLVSPLPWLAVGTGLLAAYSSGDLGAQPLFLIALCTHAHTPMASNKL